MASAAASLEAEMTALRLATRLKPFRLRVPLAEEVMEGEEVS